MCHGILPTCHVDCTFISDDNKMTARLEDTMGSGVTTRECAGSEVMKIRGEHLIIVSSSSND